MNNKISVQQCTMYLVSSHNVINNSATVSITNTGFIINIHKKFHNNIIESLPFNNIISWKIFKIFSETGSSTVEIGFIAHNMIVCFFTNIYGIQYLENIFKYYSSHNDMKFVDFLKAIILPTNIKFSGNFYNIVLALKSHCGNPSTLPDKEYSNRMTEFEQFH